MGALPDVRTFCEAVLYECLAMEKADVLPAYLRLFHLATALPLLTHSLPIHSVRMLSAYYASPTLASMREKGGAAAETSDGGTQQSAPLLQPAFIHALASQLDELFASLHFDAQLGRHSGGAPASHAPSTHVSDGQRRILYGAFLAFHGILPSNQMGVSAAAGAELLPFILATLMQHQGGEHALGDTRGLHATALRIAALGLSESPWARS